MFSDGTAPWFRQAPRVVDQSDQIISVNSYPLFFHTVFEAERTEALVCLHVAQNLPAVRTGGYRAALRYVQKPIYSTFSSHDVPLTKLFHLAVVRDSDWGEIRIAGVPPSKFVALGGFGPGGLKTGESNTVAIPVVR